MICDYLLLNPTWPDGRGRARAVAHLAVRQQAAVGVGADPTAPCPGGGVGPRQPPRGNGGSRGAGAAGADAPGRCRPPPPPKSGPGARAGLRCPEPLQLGGEVLVGCGGGLGAGLFLLLSFFRVRSTASWHGSRLWGCRGRCFSIFCPLPLLHLAGIWGEEGANVVLLLFLKLRKKMEAHVSFCPYNTRLTFIIRMIDFNPPVK